MQHCINCDATEHTSVVPPALPTMAGFSSVYDLQTKRALPRAWMQKGLGENPNSCSVECTSTAFYRSVRFFKSCQPMAHTNVMSVVNYKTSCLLVAGVSVVACLRSHRLMLQVSLNMDCSSFMHHGLRRLSFTKDQPRSFSTCFLIAATLTTIPLPSPVVPLL